MRIFPTRILVATDGSEEAARRRTVFQPLGGSFANEKPPPLYSPECVEEKICELRPNGVLRSSAKELVERGTSFVVVARAYGRSSVLIARRSSIAR
jgi:hypothetical protein